ncbi:hypothetical protein AB0N50_34045 [Streptomyces pharetrae]|jgi:hypothetical protein|uniref:hypothetical protein n=1 Tax=Streptomyces pharetrae TaxID=291370 RepID=UPI003461377A
MLQRHDPGGSRATFLPGHLDPVLSHRPLAPPVSAPLAFTAFCHDHWPVYWRFSSTAAGSPHRGGELARAALQEVAARWPMVLGSASPSAAAWDLLSQKCAARRTGPAARLHRVLHRLEADALLLRHKMGLTRCQSAHAMGLAEADFELLHSRAVLSLKQ